MKIECPHCKEKTYTLKDKFFSTITKMGKCSNCEQKSARPTILSRISFFAFIIISIPNKGMLVPGIGVVLSVIAIEFALFRLEPVSQERIKNRNNYLILFILLGMVLMFFLSKLIFFTYSPNLY